MSQLRSLTPRRIANSATRYKSPGAERIRVDHSPPSSGAERVRMDPSTPLRRAGSPADRERRMSRRMSRMLIWWSNEDEPEESENENSCASSPAINPRRMNTPRVIRSEKGEKGGARQSTKKPETTPRNSGIINNLGAMFGHIKKPLSNTTINAWRPRGVPGAKSLSHTERAEAKQPVRGWLQTRASTVVDNAAAEDVKTSRRRSKSRERERALRRSKSRRSDTSKKSDDDGRSFKSREDDKRTDVDENARGRSQYLVQDLDSRDDTAQALQNLNTILKKTRPSAETTREALRTCLSAQAPRFSPLPEGISRYLWSARLEGELEVNSDEIAQVRELLDSIYKKTQPLCAEGITTLGILGCVCCRPTDQQLPWAPCVQLIASKIAQCADADTAVLSVLWLTRIAFCLVSVCEADPGADEPQDRVVSLISRLGITGNAAAEIMMTSRRILYVVRDFERTRLERTRQNVENLLQFIDGLAYVLSLAPSHSRGPALSALLVALSSSIVLLPWEADSPPEESRLCSDSEEIFVFTPRCKTKKVKQSQQGRRSLLLEPKSPARYATPSRPQKAKSPLHLELFLVSMEAVSKCGIMHQMFGQVLTFVLATLMKGFQAQYETFEFVMRGLIKSIRYNSWLCPIKRSWKGTSDVTKALLTLADRCRRYLKVNTWDSILELVAVEMPHESQVFLLGITMIMIQVGTTKPSVEDSWPLVDLAVRIQKEIRDCALNQYLRCFVGSLMMCVVWPDIHVPQSRMQMVKEIIETSVKACSNPDELSAEIAVQQLVLSASLMMSGFGLSMDFVLKTFEAIGKRVDHKHRVTTEAATLIRQSLAHVLFIKAVSILTKQPVSSVNRVSGGMSYHMLQFFDDATRQEALVRWAAEGTPETASCYHILQALLRLYDPSVPSIGRLDAIDPQAHADLLALRLMFTHNRNEVLSERAVIKECELSSLSLCVLAAMALNPDVHGLVSYADFRLSNVLVRRLLGSLSIEIAQEDRLKAIARKGNLDGWSFLAPASGRVGVMLYFSEPLLQHMLDTNQPEYVTHLYATLCPIFRKHVPFSCVRYRWEVRCALWLLCRELSTHVPESEPPPQEKSTIARAGTMLVRRPKKEKKVHVLNSEETVVIERAVAYCYSLQVYKLKTPYLRLVEHFLNVSKAYRTSGGLPHQDLIVIDPDAVVVLEDSFEEPQALTNDNVKLESKAVRFLFQPTSKQFHKLEPTKVMKGVQDLCKLSTEQLEERYQQTRDSVDLRRLLLGWHLVHKVEDQPRLFVLLALQVANLAAYLAYLVTAKKRCPETETSLAELKALEEVLIRKAECVGHPIDQVTPEGDEAQDLLKTLSMTFPQEPKQCKAEILLRISESPDGVVVRRIFPTYMLSVPVPECSLVTSVTSIYQANVSSILSAREVEKSADKKECVQKWWAARQGLEEDVNNYLKSSPSLQLILKVLSSPCHTLAEDMNKSVLELLKCQEKLMDPQFRRRVAPWTLLLVMIVSNENWEECISTGKTTRFTTPKVSDLSIHSSLFKSVIGMYCLAGLALTSQTTKPVKPSELFFASIKSMLADCGRQAVVNMNNAPVLLLLDGTLGRVPWENTWALKDRDVYRLCSLKHFARSKEPLKDTRKNRWFYVVDPLNNLPSAQEAFAAAGDIRKQWRGSCGEEIPRDQCLAGITSSDVYLYIGHQGGERVVSAASVLRYARITEVQKIPHTVLLFGCSSTGYPASFSSFVPMSPAHYWSALGVRQIVGCLWDTTDQDLDRLVGRLLSMFVSGVPLIDAIKDARPHCKLPHLTSASLVMHTG